MGGDTKLISTEVPEISTLSYYLGMIDPTEPKDKSAPTDFQWQILKTRFFLWKNPEVIAAPQAKRTSHIHIIISKDFANVLPQRVKDQKLILSGPYPLNDYTYQECINYTLTFRMAPLWQKIENHFVYSNEFLSSEEPMEAIKFGLSLLDNTIRMSCTMQRVRLDLLNLEALHVDIDALRQTGRAPIHQTVYILPQLKKGTAVDICVKIPDECPFQTYSQLRRHWKNTHGYRLPHDEQGMLYVRVSFGWNNTAYSYPVVCTRPSKLHPLKSKNPDLCLLRFCEDMLKRCPTICGQDIKIFVQEEDESISLGDFVQQIKDAETEKKGKSSGKAKKSVPVRMQEPEFLENTVMPFSLDKPLSGKATKSVPVHIQEPESLENSVMPFSLDQTLSNEVVPEPIQEVNVQTIDIPTVTTISTPYRTSSFGSTTSTPISSSSVLRNTAEFVPILSPIIKESPKIYLTPSGDRIIIKPLSEVNAIALKRPQTILPAECLKSTGQEVIEPVTKKPAQPSEIENLARAKALYRINVPVLKNFCRENNIFFTTKDRKDALMQKIYNFYGVE